RLARGCVRGWGGFGRGGDREGREIAPPVVAAVLPVIALFCTRRVPAAANNGSVMAPPDDPLRLLANVLLRMTKVLGVKPVGGVALGVPKKYRPPPPVVDPATFPETVLFSPTSP